MKIDDIRENRPVLGFVLRGLGPAAPHRRRCADRFRPGEQTHELRAPRDRRSAAFPGAVLGDARQRRVRGRVTPGGAHRGAGHAQGGLLDRDRRRHAAGARREALRARIHRGPLARAAVHLRQLPALGAAARAGRGEEGRAPATATACCASTCPSASPAARAARATQGRLSDGATAAGAAVRACGPVGPAGSASIAAVAICTDDDDAAVAPEAGCVPLTRPDRPDRAGPGRRSRWRCRCGTCRRPRAGPAPAQRHRPGPAAARPHPTGAQANSGSLKVPEGMAESRNRFKRRFSRFNPPDGPFRPPHPSNEGWIPADPGEEASRMPRPALRA